MTLEYVLPMLWYKNNSQNIGFKILKWIIFSLKVILNAVYCMKYSV